MCCDPRSGCSIYHEGAPSVKIYAPSLTLNTAAAAAAAADAAASNSRYGSPAAQRATRLDGRCRLLRQRCWCHHPCTPTLPVWRTQQLGSQAAAGHAQWRGVYTVCVRHIVYYTQVRRGPWVLCNARLSALPLVLLPKLGCAVFGCRWYSCFERSVHALCCTCSLSFPIYEWSKGRIDQKESAAAVALWAAL
jgi:hypothetical protein